MQPENNDSTLLGWRLFQQGKEAGLNYVFKELYAPATLFAFQYLKNKALAEEIAADAFLKLWKMHQKLDSFAAIRNYLFKIIVLDCRRAASKETNRAIILIDDVVQIATKQNHFESLLKAETYHQLYRALNRLSPENRRVMEWHFFEDKGTTEIARQLGKSTSTIHTQKTRSLQALKKILKKNPLSLFIFLLLGCNW